MLNSIGNAILLFLRFDRDGSFPILISQLFYFLFVADDETLIGNGGESDLETIRAFPLSDMEGGEQSFFTIGDDDDHLPKHLAKYQRFDNC